MIDVKAIGTPSYNILLDFLRCQAKHPNPTSPEAKVDEEKKKECMKLAKMYSTCHMAVMGVGNYKGKKHCATEMTELFKCVNPDAISDG